MLIGLIFFAVVVWFIYEHVSLKQTWVKNVFIGIFSIIIAAVTYFVIGIPCYVAGFGVIEKYPVRTAELIAIDESNKFKGLFVLVSGTIENPLNYIFCRKTENNSIKLGMVQAEEATIYEYGPQEQKEPEIIEFKFRQKINESYWWLYYFVPLNLQATTYEIHVPKGSVQSTFELDLK